MDKPSTTRWDADVLLRDGTAAHLRMIAPADAQALVDFYDRVSDESKYFRFFAPYPKLSDSDVQRFTHVDGKERVAFVLTLGPDIIAVGRFDAITEKEAEVAFLVEDAHQGRGIGQLLLEHLAQAGRELGYTHFYADVLPANIRMIQVFDEMGYSTTRETEYNIIRMTLDIQATTNAVGVMRRREHRAEAASINRIMNVKNVAVVGASRREDSVGAATVQNLVMGGFTGNVYAVNPHADPVSGLPAYTAVSDIPGPVDLAIVAVPAEAVADVVIDCANKDVHTMIVISSGFAEQGEEGIRRQREVLGLARSYGLRLIGPNCLGIINTDPGIRMNASLSAVMPPRGRVGFFCQSGALGTAILERVARRGLGLSTFVSAGNRADVSGNDLLQYWEEDESTEVVLLYLESIGNPRKFARIARNVSLEKPIVAVKSGRSTQGVPVGHAVRETQAPQAAVDALFAQSGVIQVDSLDEAFDITQLLAHQPLPRGKRIAIVGNSDALALLVGDAASGQGLEVTKTISLGAAATADDFETALDVALDNDEVDALVALYIPPLNVSGVEFAHVLAAVAEQADKPIVSTFLGAKGVPELLRVPELGGSAGRGSVPSYHAPESAVKALAHAVSYAKWLDRDHGAVREIEHDQDAARAFVAKFLGENPKGGALSFDQSVELLGLYGLDLWPMTQVATIEEAIAAAERFGWDVALKDTSEKLRGRPDLAHLKRHLADTEDLKAAWDELIALIGHGNNQFVVQKTAGPGVPVSIGAQEDKLFGPLVSVALAGVPSDLMGDRSYGIPPLTDQDAKQMLLDLRSAPLFFGYRGSEPVDVAAIAEAVERIALLKDELPEVLELELEPVLVHENAMSILNARISLGPTSDRRFGTYVRRLSRPTGLGDTLAQ